jgi:hypothetical protein
MLFGVIITGGVIIFVVAVVEAIKAVERYRLRRLGVRASCRSPRGRDGQLLARSPFRPTSRFERWWERSMPAWWVGWPTWFRDPRASLSRRR